MTEKRNALAGLFAACWKDDALKARFMADPKTVLAERGMEMPDGMDVTVVANTDNTVHITMPMAPAGHADLSREHRAWHRPHHNYIMTEKRNTLAELFAACWKDDALKARFMADPKTVLAERGMEMPDGMDVTVIANTDNTVHITMPMAPAGYAELSDEELSNAAGGWGLKNVTKIFIN